VCVREREREEHLLDVSFGFVTSEHKELK